MATKKSLSINPAHAGELHRDLGVPEGQTLTEAEIQQGLDSKDPAVRLRARFAKNARSFTHGGAT